MLVGIPDVITYANFGEDWLGGLWEARGSNLTFSIDFDRRSYNSLAAQVVMRLNNHTWKLPVGTSGYATMVHGRGCNPHRPTTTFAKLEMTSLMTS